MIRSFDPEIMRKAFEPHVRYHDDKMDYDAWIGNRKNVMYVIDNGDVGLATYEYPGLYNVHWFFNQTRGKAAIKLAQEMLDALFQDEGAQIVRGLTPVDLKPARWLAKYIGFKSYGVVKCPEDDGPNEGFCELMLLTKHEFYENYKGKTNES